MQTDAFTDWLLQSDIPTIRYFTLHHLIGLPANDPHVQEARQEIMLNGPVPVILAKQTEAGHWAGEHSYYTPKYTSTHWSLLLLTELDADGSDPRFLQGVEWMLTATEAHLNTDIETHKDEWECLWANILRYAVHCGYADDPRVQRLSQYLTATLKNQCQCPFNKGLPCAWGAARTLWGLAALPTASRSPEVAAAIADTLAFLLDSYQLSEANYPTPGKPHPLWFKLNFPLFYQADILFVLRMLRDLHALEQPGAQSSLDWLAAQRKADGHWHGSSPYRSRTWRVIGNAEETNRWVSLQAAMILQDAA